MNIKPFITNDRAVFFDFVKKYCELNSTILDVGAGDGSFARYINRTDTYLLDSNEVTVELLKKSFPNVFLNKLPTLPFDTNFFNIIHCSHVIEHLEPDILYKTLLEINRVLKNDGILIISTPLLWSEFYDDLSHIKPYNSKVFKKYLVWGERYNCTRELISKNYSVLEEINRYNKMKPFDNIYHPNFLIYIMIRVLSKIVAFLGFCKLEKSGYTIVMRKSK